MLRPTKPTLPLLSKSEVKTLTKSQKNAKFWLQNAIKVTFFNSVTQNFIENPYCPLKEGEFISNKAWVGTTPGTRSQEHKNTNFCQMANPLP